MLNVVDEGLFKFSDRDIRKVSHIRILQEEGLIALLAGERHYIIIIKSRSARNVCVMLTNAIFIYYHILL